MNPNTISGALRLRVITLGLLEGQRYEMAAPWADQWMAVTGNDFQAVWHRLMVDRWQERWFDVLIRCQQFESQFSDQTDFVTLSEVAQREVSKGVKLEGSK